MKNLIRTFLLLGCFAPFAMATTVSVPGIADPWLAGMPAGSLDNVLTPEPADAAPASSPVLGLFVSGGDVITWSATGIVGHPGDLSGPDGASIASHLVGANNGISDVLTPISGLIGVFLGPGQPDLNPAPAALDFSTQAARDYLFLSPALQQVFFMGDGITSLLAGQSLIAPAGATRLFLGIMDGYGWANNVGEFEVTLNGVPDSCEYGWLAMVGVLGLAAIRRQHALKSN